MKIYRLVMLWGLSVCAFGQWPHWPNTGATNLSGPAPKTADGKPDLSGTWGYVRPPGTPAPAETNQIMNCNPATQFCNIGAGLKGGLPLQPWAAELRAKRLADNSKGNPDSHCLPLGLMQMHTHPYPRKMIQAADEVIILNEANEGVRQIFTDGRALPKDPEPWWYGYSTGHWEGDTLVVQSAGFRDLGWLDFQGSPLTESGKFTERFRRVDYGHLQIEITVDDPKAYTKPWTVTVYQQLMQGTQIIEFVCLENNKDETHLVGK